MLRPTAGERVIHPVAVRALDGSVYACTRCKATVRVPEDQRDSWYWVDPRVEVWKQEQRALRAKRKKRKDHGLTETHDPQYLHPGQMPGVCEKAVRV